MTCATCLFCIGHWCTNPEALKWNTCVKGEKPCRDYAELKKGVA